MCIAEKLDTSTEEASSIVLMVPAAASGYDPSRLDKSPVVIIMPSTATVASSWKQGYDPIVGGDFPDDGRYEGFVEGFVEGGGEGVPHIRRLVWCESRWKIKTGGQFLGLAQFHTGTWATASRATGLNDPFNPYHQGYNTAYWIGALANPGGIGGWPSCWWV